jgi:hypothetical protein
MRQPITQACRRAASSPNLTLGQKVVKPVTKKPKPPIHPSPSQNLFRFHLKFGSRQSMLYYICSIFAVRRDDGAVSGWTAPALALPQQVPYIPYIILPYIIQDQQCTTMCEMAWGGVRVEESSAAQAGHIHCAMQHSHREMPIEYSTTPETSCPIPARAH